VRELRNCLRAMTEYSESNLLGPNSIPRRVFELILAQKPEGAAKTKINVHNPSAENRDGKDFWPARVAESILESDGTCRIVLREAELFAGVCAALESRSQKVSLRDLERLLGMSRMTVSRRLKEVVSLGRENLLPASLRSKHTDGGAE
jgi:hypothetical protein